MAKRLNERNIGSHALDGRPKKRNKLNEYEIDIILHLINNIYDAMQYDEYLGKYVDGGRVTISLTGEQLYDIFEARRKLEILKNK